MLNPAAWFAETKLVIDPSVFIEDVPPAFQFQETWFLWSGLNLLSLPNANPSLLKAVKPCATVTSFEVKFEKRVFVTPLTLSVKTWSVPELRDFIQVRSGLKPTPVIGLWCWLTPLDHKVVSKLLAKLGVVVEGSAAKAR